MSSSVRKLVLRFGEQFDLRIQGASDCLCHLDIKPETGGDYEVVLGLSPVAANLVCNQGNVDRSVDNPERGEPVNQSYRNAIGIAGCGQQSAILNNHFPSSQVSRQSFGSPYNQEGAILGCNSPDGKSRAWRIIDGKHVEIDLNTGLPLVEAA